MNGSISLDSIVGSTRADSLIRLGGPYSSSGDEEIDCNNQSNRFSRVFYIAFNPSSSSIATPTNLSTLDMPSIFMSLTACIQQQSRLNFGATSTITNLFLKQKHRLEQVGRDTGRQLILQVSGNAVTMEVQNKRVRLVPTCIRALTPMQINKAADITEDKMPCH